MGCSSNSFSFHRHSSNATYWERCSFPFLTAAEAPRRRRRLGLNIGGSLRAASVLAVGRPLFCPTYTIRCPKDTFWTFLSKLFLFTYCATVKAQVRACFWPQGYQSYVGTYTDTQTHRYLKTWGQSLQAFCWQFKRLLHAALAGSARCRQNYALAWRWLAARSHIRPEPVIAAH